MKNSKINLDDVSKPLTEKERAVLSYIEEHLLRKGLSPSFQEIRDHFGFASFNSVQNYLRQLQNKGYVFNPPHQKRAIQVLKSARSVSEEMSKMSGLSESVDFEIPLLGKVAAGRPLEAFASNEFLPVSKSLLKNPHLSFALQVSGTSMIEEGILDRDFLLVQKQETANNGEIVVATIDQESTVKKYFYRASEKPHRQVELRPANSNLSSQWYSPEQVSIRGLVVGLIRKF